MSIRPLAFASTLLVAACAAPARCREPTVSARVVAPTPPRSAPATVEVEGIRVSLLGLRVAAPPYVAGEDELSAIGSLWSHTSVDLLVVSRRGGILGVAAESTRLDALEDDNGEPVRDRAPSSRRPSPPAGFHEFADVAHDRTAMRVTLDVPGSAAPGARELRLRGTLGVALGSEPIAVTTLLELRAGAVATLADLSMRVRDIRATAESTRIVLEIPSDAAASDALGDLTVRAGGAPVDIVRRGRSSWSADGQARTELTLELAATDLTQIEIAASIPRARRVVVVPLDLRFGVGL